MIYCDPSLFLKAFHYHEDIFNSQGYFPTPKEKLKAGKTVKSECKKESLFYADARPFILLRKEPRIIYKRKVKKKIFFLKITVKE